MPAYERKLKKGNRWWYKLDFNGKTYFSQAIYLTKKQAQQAEAQKRVELEEAQRNPKQSVMLLEVMESRLDQLKAKKSRLYYEQNKESYRKFLEFVGREAKADEITKKLVNDFLVKEAINYQKRGMTNSVVNRQLRLLKALFFHAEMFGIERNPCRRIAFFSQEKKIKRLPTHDEFQAVLNECNDRQRFLLLFLSETGARISEALRLTGEDVAESYIVLYTRKARNSDLIPRKVPRPACLDGLTFSPKQRIFHDWNGSGDFRPHFLQRIVKRLGLPAWNFHHLRHLYASRLVMDNTPLTVVQERLGHTSIMTTSIYLQSLPVARS